jgi:hypothetical protein
LGIGESSENRMGKVGQGRDLGRDPASGVVKLICPVSRLSYEPPFFEGVKAATITDDNVVEEFNADDFSGINKFSRDSQVFFRWFGVTAWMIV